MDCKKVPIAIVAAALVLLLIGALRAGEWRAWTSFQNVRAMTVVDAGIVAVTSGGALIITDPNQAGQMWTNIDGLGSNDLYDVIGDESGRIWLAADGRLIRIESEQATQFLFSDEDDDPIGLSCLSDAGDYLWVGTDIGLVLFSKEDDGGQIQDSYGRFGDLPDFPRVNDILLNEDSIWLATSNGLAVAETTDLRLLKQRSSWTTYDAATVGSNMITRLVQFDGYLYVLTPEGLSQIDFQSGSPERTLLWDGTDQVSYDLKVAGDSLLFFHGGGYGVVSTGSLTLYSTPFLHSPPVTMLKSAGLEWWATDGQGIVYGNAHDGYTVDRFGGLPGSNVSDLTIGEDGVITAGFTLTQAARYQGDGWQALDFWVREGTTWLTSNPDGHPLIGTRGNGLWLAESDTLINYDELNTTLRGNSDSPPAGLEFVFINGLTRSSEHFFASCYRAVNGYPIAIARWDAFDDPLHGWDSLGVGDGLTTDRTYQIDYYQGELAVGTEATGVFVCPVGAEPFARPRQACRQLTRANSLLRSDIAKVVEYDIDGTLWVGTNEGLSRYDIGIDRFVDVDLPAGIDRNVTDLAFDSRGNLWVGTASGLARFDRSDNDFTIYNMASGSLVNNQIRALHYDSTSGDLYVATAGGISWLPSQTGQPEDNIEQVLAFPNPFEVHSPSDYLSFNYASPGTVRIFTVAGELVRQMDVNQRWYGRNDKGQAVASGVYLWILTDGSDQIGRGKILLVRR